MKEKNQATTQETTHPQHPAQRPDKKGRNSNIKQTLGELGEDLGDTVSEAGRNMLENLFTTSAGWKIVLSLLGFAVIWFMWGFWWAVILLAVVWGVVLVKNLMDD